MAWPGYPQVPTNSRPLSANTTFPGFLLLVCRSKHSSSPRRMIMSRECKSNSSHLQSPKAHNVSSCSFFNQLHERLLQTGSIGSYQCIPIQLQNALSNTKIAKHPVSSGSASLRLLSSGPACTSVKLPQLASLGQGR